jgi:hypothetical protein
MTTIKNDKEALELALSLAITASSDEKADECIKMADKFAKHMEKKDVEMAMKKVLDRLVESLEADANDK